MERTEILELFPDATKEQIDAIMSINGADINNAKKSVKDIEAKLAAAQTALATPSEELIAAKKQATALQEKINQMEAAETVRVMREKIANERGIPVKLLTGATEEDCITQAENIMSFTKEVNKYPVVRDGGEKPIPNKKQTTRDQFADWFNNLT